MRDLTVSDIEHIVDNQEPEDYMTEYKHPDALSNTKKVAKSISSFANEEGGYIIYGIDNNHNLINIPRREIDNKLNLISNVVRTKISGLLSVHPYKILVRRKNIIVVKVPKSYTAPHMASSEHRFFHRVSTGTGRFDITPMNETEIAKKYEERLSIMSKHEKKIKEKIDDIWKKGYFGYSFSVFPLFPADLRKIKKEDIRKFFVDEKSGSRIRFPNLYLQWDAKTHFHGFYLDGSPQLPRRLEINYDGVINFRISATGGNYMHMHQVSKYLLDFLKFVKFFYSENNISTNLDFVISISTIDLRLKFGTSDGDTRNAVADNVNVKRPYETYFCHNLNDEKEPDICMKLLDGLAKWYDQDLSQMELGI